MDVHIIMTDIFQCIQIKFKVFQICCRPKNYLFLIPEKMWISFFCWPKEKLKSIIFSSLVWISSNKRWTAFKARRHNFFYWFHNFLTSNIQTFAVSLFKARHAIVCIIMTYSRPMLRAPYDMILLNQSSKWWQQTFSTLAGIEPGYFDHEPWLLDQGANAITSDFVVDFVVTLVPTVLWDGQK